MSKTAIAEPHADQQPSLLKRIQDMLGVRRLRSDQDLVRLVEGRLAVGVVEGLRHAGLTDDEIYSLIVPRRTLTHRRARREALVGKNQIEPCGSRVLLHSASRCSE